MQSAKGSSPSFNYDAVRHASFADSPVGSRIRARLEPSGAQVASRSQRASVAAQQQPAGAPRMNAKFRASLEQTSREVGVLIGALSHTPELPLDRELAVKTMRELHSTMKPMTDRGADPLEVYQARVAHHLERMTFDELIALRTGLCSDDASDLGSSVDLVDVLEQGASRELYQRIGAKGGRYFLGGPDFGGEIFVNGDRAFTDDVERVGQWLDTGGIDSDLAQAIMQASSDEFALNCFALPLGSPLQVIAEGSIQMRRDEARINFLSSADKVIQQPNSSIVDLDFAQFSLRQHRKLSSVMGVPIDPAVEAKLTTQLRPSLRNAVVSDEFQHQFNPGLSTAKILDELGINWSFERHLKSGNLEEAVRLFIDRKVPDPTHDLAAELCTECAMKGQWGWVETIILHGLLGDGERMHTFAGHVLVGYASNGEWAATEEAMRSGLGRVGANAANMVLDMCLNKKDLREALFSHLGLGDDLRRYSQRLSTALLLIATGAFGDQTRAACLKVLDAFSTSVVGTQLLQQQIPPDWYNMHGIAHDRFRTTHEAQVAQTPEAEPSSMATDPNSVD